MRTLYAIFLIFLGISSAASAEQIALPQDLSHVLVLRLESLLACVVDNRAAHVIRLAALPPSPGASAKKLPVSALVKRMTKSIRKLRAAIRQSVATSRRRKLRAKKKRQESKREELVQAQAACNRFGEGFRSPGSSSSSSASNSSQSSIPGFCSSSSAVSSTYPRPATTFYVWPLASGVADGSSWSNAYHDLPQSLERDALYYIGAGQYGPHRFNDSGTNTIMLLRATESDHGNDSGWVNSIAEGQAVFGPVVFSGSNYVLDGVYRYGFKLVGAYKGTVMEVTAAATNIHVRNSDFDANFQMSNGYHSDGACNVINLHGDTITIESSDIHNAADDGVGVYGDNITIRSSRIHKLHGCGTDGGCGPCYNGHSDGLELQATKNVTLIGNLVYDIQSTAALITGQWSPGNYTENLLMFNNIFYTPATGITVYLYYIRGARVFNNVIWGRTQGSRYGGLAIGPEVTDLQLYNNIILNINYNHLGAAYDPVNHKIDYNVFAMIASSEYHANTHDIVANPKFRDIVVSSSIDDHPADIIPENFSLLDGSPAIDAGIPVPEYVTGDICGTSRPRDGDGSGSAEYDIGAFER